MSTQVQHRRGTAAQHEAFTGAMSEITHDTTNNNLRVHNGQKPGGYATLMEDQLGVAGGVATLDETGLVPEPQLGNTYSALGEYLGNPNGIATLDSTGNVPEAQLGNVPKSYDYASTSALSEAEVPAAVTYVRTAGYYDAGDGGDALYIRVASEPSHAGKVQSADGAWWKYVPSGGALNVKCFGAVGDGVADDTTPIQNALNAISMGFSNTMYFPHGKYLVSTSLSYTNTVPGSAPVQIIGESQTGTEIWFSGSGNLFTFTLGAASNQRVNGCVIKRLTLSSRSGRTSGGDAIRVIRTASAVVAPSNLFEDITIIQEGSTYWSNGVHTTDCADQWLNRCYIMQFGDSSSSNLFVDNNLTTQSVFGLYITNSSFNGATSGVKIRGQLESVYVTDCSIAGATKVLDLDASGTTYGNPHLTVKGCHLNSKQYAIYAINWRAILITGSDIYSGVGTGDIAGDNIYLNSCNKVVISGNKVEVGSVGVARSGIAIVSTTEVSISGNIITNVSASGIVMSGLATSRVIISGNEIRGYNDGTLNDNGIYIASVSSDGMFNITGNIIDYFSTPVTASADYSLVVGNIARNCTNTYNVLGTGSISANNIG